tara:strand:+ start:331 stop:618 length:288 start_codon:yes stop_codon:yes gene_type:complete
MAHPLLQHVQWNAVHCGVYPEPMAQALRELLSPIQATRIVPGAKAGSMLCVTHEMGFARKVADRVIFMANGAIIEEDDPETILSAPQNTRARLHC